MTEPFLLRFARPCVSPSRAPVDPNYEYDDSIDMMRWLGSPDSPPVVEAYGPGGPDDKDGPDKPPPTKKCDIEKGEDQKDRLMWRRY